MGTELILLVVIVTTLYLCLNLSRRRHIFKCPFFLMLLVDCFLAIMAFILRQSQSNMELSNVLSIVAIGAAIFLIPVPALLRNLSVYTYHRGWIHLAKSFLSICDVLQPGMGAKQEREVLNTMITVREDRVDELVETLRKHTTKLSQSKGKVFVSERVLALYLYARRWEQAIVVYEEELEDIDTPVSIDLLVEVFRSYCEMGHYTKAITLMNRIEEDLRSKEVPAIIMRDRARLIFLSFMGRTDAVSILIRPSSLLGSFLSKSMSDFWLAVAHTHQDNKEEAARLFTNAIKNSRKDSFVCQAVKERLAVLDTVQLNRPDDASILLADKLCQEIIEGQNNQQHKIPWRLQANHAGIVTKTLIVINVLIALVSYLGIDQESIIMAGGRYQTGIDSGQWWRLLSSMFIHDGLTHLFFNMYGLWVLGKLVETSLGSVRFFVVYMTAGLFGSLAGYMLTNVPNSIGSSGAVLGILGACLIELGLFRQIYKTKQGASLFRILLFLSIVNMSLGLFMPLIDQHAHVGGMVGGIMMTLWLSPRSFLGKHQSTGLLSIIFAVSFVLSLLYALGSIGP